MESAGHLLGWLVGWLDFGEGIEWITVHWG